MGVIDDFTLYPYSKCIRHTSGTTVYTVTEFYSWIQNLMDEPAYLSYEAPIKYNTPTSFTMLNGWFIDNGDGSNALQYLKGGSIDTLGYDTIDDPVYMLDLNNDGATYAAFIAGDKDKTFRDDATNVGPVLAYKNNWPVTNEGRVWVRDTRAVPATIADNSVCDVDTGTGAGWAEGASVNGDETYTNLYTIADFPGSPNPQVYVYQNNWKTGTSERISEWSGLSNFDRGTIDILIPVKLGGSLIDSGLVRVRVRQTGDTFTFVDADLSSGSRTPVSTETGKDSVNITTGEHYMFYDGATSPSISTGDVIQDISTGTGAA